MDKTIEFACYSVRMCHFLRSRGLRYEYKDINKRTGTPYYVFKKSEELDTSITLWNKVKTL